LAGALEVEPLDLFVETKAGVRHQVIDATLGANRAQLEHVLTVLRRSEPMVPSPAELRSRIAALPHALRTAVRDLLGGLHQPHTRADAGVGIDLTDLRPSELVLVDGVVAAFEHYVDYGTRIVRASPREGETTRRPHLERRKGRPKK
jgi:hypothetical protein